MKGTPSGKGCPSSAKRRNLSVVRSVVKNAPCPLPETVSRFGQGAFFIPLTVCMVTLRAGLSKPFLRCPRLRNWGTENNRKSSKPLNSHAHPPLSIPQQDGQPAGQQKRERAEEIPKKLEKFHGRRTICARIGASPLMLISVVLTHRS